MMAINFSFFVGCVWPTSMSFGALFLYLCCVENIRAYMTCSKKDLVKRCAM